MALLPMSRRPTPEDSAHELPVKRLSQAMHVPLELPLSTSHPQHIRPQFFRGFPDLHRKVKTATGGLPMFTPAQESRRTDTWYQNKRQCSGTGVLELTFEVIDPDGAATLGHGLGVQHLVEEVVAEGNVPRDIPVRQPSCLELLPSLSHHASLHVP